MPQILLTLVKLVGLYEFKSRFRYNGVDEFPNQNLRCVRGRVRAEAG